TDCATYRYNEALIGLPPTNNPLQWALKAYLMQLKYRAVNNNDGSASDFGSLDPTSLQDDDPTRLNGTMQFAFVLGRSVKDALGVIRDAPVKSCSGSTCIDVEAAITSGAARIQLKDRLFDPMCLDTDTTCTYPAEKCRYVPLVPKTLALNPASVRATAAKLVAAIQQVATATTPTDTLQRHLQVAMTSSNDVFSDTVNLFWAAVVTGTKPKTLKAVPNFCNTPKFNPADGTLTAAWQANPCCNPLLAAFVCCVPQNVPNGVINVITGIQPAVVNAYCPLQSDLMLAFLNGAYVGLSTAQNAANALDVSIGNTTWTALDIISTTCQTNIPNAASVTCAVDSDCAAAVCSQSKCNVDPTTLVGACTVPWDDMIGCTVECFANNMDPLLLRYVKQDWGLTSASTATDFKNAFIATATQ
ncbi:hypothetical protein As57867_012944, partial [Aphanomyces stellatus]